MSEPTFDIIIPTYNNRAELSQCLDGFSRIAAPDFRILVCIDGSTDNTAAFLSDSRYTFPMQVLQHPDTKRHGRNPTRNLALPVLKAKYLLFLDSDTVPQPDLLTQHLTWLEQNDGVSIGTITYTNTKTSLWARYIHTRGRYRLPGNSLIGYQFFNTGNAALRTRYFLDLGGQDPSMTHYGGGDVEFAIRVHDAYKIPFYNNTRAVAFSEMNKDLNTALAQMIEFGTFNLHHSYQKHPAHRHLNATELMSGKGLLSVAYGLLFPRWAVQAIKRFTENAPNAIQLLFVRYLVLAHIRKGFVDRKGF